MISLDISKKKPSAIHAVTELPRTFQDAAHLRLATPLLKKCPKGDGHGVMVLPGFLGSDTLNESLIEFLKALGYQAQGWDQGRNLGPSQERLDGARETVRQMAEQTGGTISLIGHSLGGIYAREFARETPNQIRQVISLGSPINQNRTAETSSSRLFDQLNPSEASNTRSEIPIVPPVPNTAVFTRADGIVAWGNSIQRDGHHESDNIEVRGSHCGLTLNASVWYLIADRLAQAEGEWRSFNRNGWRQFAYPQGKEAELSSQQRSAN